MSIGKKSGDRGKKGVKALLPWASEAEKKKRLGEEEPCKIVSALKNRGSKVLIKVANVHQKGGKSGGKHNTFS